MGWIVISLVGVCARVRLCFLDTPRACGYIRMRVGNKLNGSQIRLEALRDVMCCKVSY